MAELNPRIRRPALQQIVADSQIKTTLNQVIEAIQPLLGQNRDKLERAITFKDLEESGFDLSSVGGSFAVVPPVVENPPDLTTPPAITGVNVAVTFNNVILSWGAAGYGNHAYVEVWRAPAWKDAAKTSPGTLGDAAQIGISTTTGFANAVQPGDGYRYWLRNVSTPGVKGPWSTTDGHLAEAPNTPDYYLDKISGEIKQSHLYGSLSAEIDKIAVQGAAIDAHDTTLGEHQSGLNALELVTQSNASAIDANKLVADGHTAALDTHQNLLDEHGVRLGTNEANIVTLSTVQSEQDAVLVAYGNRLTVNESTISNVQSVQQSQGETIALHSSQIATNAGTIATVSQVVDNHDFTLLAHSQTLESQDASIANLTSITTTQGETIAQNSSAIATANGQIVTLTQAVDNAEATLLSHGTRLSTAEGSITTLSQVQDDQDGVLVAHSSRLQTAEGSITSLQQVQSSQGQTLVQHGNTLTNHGTSITSLQTIQSTLEQTVASHTTQLSTQNAAIQENATLIETVDGKVTGEYTVKIDAGGVVSGFGLFGDDSGSSAFGVRADRFFVAGPQGSPHANVMPFIVDAELGVLINDAYIDNAFVTNLVTATVTADYINAVEFYAIKVIGGTLEIGNRFAVDGAGNLIANYANLYGATIRKPDGTIVMSSNGTMSLDFVTGVGDMAKLDNISAANSSTYIRAAAIKEAHIDSAFLNKLVLDGEVITLRKVSQFSTEKGSTGFIKVLTSALSFSDTTSNSLLQAIVNLQVKEFTSFGWSNYANSNFQSVFLEYELRQSGVVKARGTVTVGALGDSALEGTTYERIDAQTVTAFHAWAPVLGTNTVELWVKTYYRKNGSNYSFKISSGSLTLDGGVAVNK